MYVLRKKCKVYYRDKNNPNDILYFEGEGTTNDEALADAKENCYGAVVPPIDSYLNKCQIIAQDASGNERVSYLDTYIPDPNDHIHLDGQSERNRVRHNVHRWSSERYLSTNGDHFISGHGPVEWFGDDITIILFSKAVLLNVASSDIGPSGPTHPDRISPIFHYCQSKGYLGGYGPVEWAGGHEIVVAFTAEHAGLPFHASDNELAACGGAKKVCQVHRLAQKKGYLTGFLVDWAQGDNVIFPINKVAGINHGLKYTGSISAWGP